MESLLFAAEGGLSFKMSASRAASVCATRGEEQQQQGYLSKEWKEQATHAPLCHLSPQARFPPLDLTMTSSLRHDTLIASPSPSPCWRRRRWTKRGKRESGQVWEKNQERRLAWAGSRLRLTTFHQARDSDGSKLGWRRAACASAIPLLQAI